MERGEDVDDEIECITTKYVKVLNPRLIPGIDTGAEEEVLDPEIQIPQLKEFARLFCLFLQLCIMHCVVLGNIERSLLGSYVQQEYYVLVIQT